MTSSSWLKKLHRKSARGFRGYPVGTLAFYGPNDRRATKLVAGIVPAENVTASVLKKWFSETLDVRLDASIGKEVEDFFASFGPRSYAVAQGIIGCPHQEGVDYPHGQPCPQCPFWRNRDRWQYA